MEGFKVCSKCKEEKSKDQFNKKIKAKDGLNSWCLTCCKISQRTHYLNNSDKLKEKSRKYREENLIVLGPPKPTIAQIKKIKGELKEQQKREYLEGILTEQVKTCNKCGLVKSLADFNKHPTCLGGYSNRCKDCERKYKHSHYQKNKETIQNKTIKYRKNNPEKYREYGKQWRLRHPEQDSQIHKRYRLENADIIKLRYGKYREKNKDKIRTRGKVYRLKYPELIRNRRILYRETHKDYFKLYYTRKFDQIKDYQKEYRGKNVEKLKEYHKTHYKNNKNTYKEKASLYASLNRDKVRERKSRWYRSNLELISKRRRVYRKSNHERISAAYHNYRARLIGNGGSHTSQEWVALKTKYNFTCLKCGKKEPEIRLTKDHVFPVNLGGRNDIKNIQCLCGPCNSSKNKKWQDYRPDSKTYGEGWKKPSLWA